MTGLVSFLDIRPSHASLPQPIPFPPNEAVTPTDDLAGTPTVPDADLKRNGVSPTEGPTLQPSVGISDLPTVGVITTEGSPETPTVIYDVNVVASAVPTEGEPQSPSVGLSDLPTVGDSTTEGQQEPPTVPVDDLKVKGVAPTERGFVTPTVVSSGGSPTVGVSTADIPSFAWVSLVTGSLYETKRVQRVVLAQQSMSLGEERIYQAIWHAPEGVIQINKRVKSFSMGYDRLARLTRLNEKSIRDIVPKLIDKKILEVVKREDSWTRTGRTYQIYSYEEILDRQRAAGLSYVVKNGRAVEFVRSTARSSDTPTVGQPPTETVGVTHTGTVGHTTTGTVGVTPTPLDNRQSTSQTSSAVREALRQYTTVDDAAIRRIINACREHAPDCTDDEIAHFIHEKSVFVTMRGSTIKNPMGHFIATVPLCFEGETFRLYRQAQRSEASTCSVCHGTRRILRKFPLDTGEWSAVKAALAQRISPGAYANWLEQTFHGGLIDGELHVRVPNLTTQTWIQEEYGELIWDVIRSLGLAVVTLRFEALSESECYEPCSACYPHREAL